MSQRYVDGNTVISVNRHRDGLQASLTVRHARAARGAAGAVDVRRAPMISLPPERSQTRRALSQKATWPRCRQD